MSDISAQKETGETPFYKDEDFWAPIIGLGIFSFILAAAYGLSIAMPLDGIQVNPDNDRQIIQEWRLAHKDMVSCDFGRGIRFSLENKEHVPEALRPALTAGLANGACRLVVPQG